MSAVEPGSATSGLVERVKSILLRPAPTWDVIDVEPATTSGLFKNYAMILAAIPAICGLIGVLAFSGMLGGAFGMGAGCPMPCGSCIGVCRIPGWDLRPCHSAGFSRSSNAVRRLAGRLR